MAALLLVLSCLRETAGGQQQSSRLAVHVHALGSAAMQPPLSPNLRPDGIERRLATCCVYDLYTHCHFVHDVLPLPGLFVNCCRCAAAQAGR
jgi:hypothetical protein